MPGRDAQRTHHGVMHSPQSFRGSADLQAIISHQHEPELMATPNLPPGFDFTDPDIYAHRLPVQELAELRATAPIWWNEQPLDQGGFGDGGYWVVTKHRDIREVSLRSDVFSSAKKSIVPRYREDLAQGQIEAGRASMIMMDDPEHSRLRKIVARGFTPRAVERLRADLSERARRIAHAPRQRGRATSSSRWPANCHCRPSPACSACRRRTVASCSTGPTR